MSELAELARMVVAMQPTHMDISDLPVFKEWQGAADLFKRETVIVETGGMTDAGWLSAAYYEMIGEENTHLGPEVQVEYFFQLFRRAADATVRSIFNAKPRRKVWLSIRLGCWMNKTIHEASSGVLFFMDTMYRFQERDDGQHNRQAEPRR